MENKRKNWTYSRTLSIRSQCTHDHQNSRFIYSRFLGYPWGKRLLLEDKQKFPGSTFSASGSSEGHSASDARITSGSSWCAPVSDEKHYLQVDLRTLHRVYFVITYGDSTSPKWVVTYNLSYTVDFLNWMTIKVRESAIINNDHNILPCTWSLIVPPIEYSA